jgi:hypothetical protein
MVDGVGTHGYDVPLFAIRPMGEVGTTITMGFRRRPATDCFPVSSSRDYRFHLLLEALGLVGTSSTP